MSNKNTVDYLDEDPIISGQKFTCLSFLTDKKNKIKIMGIKSRGNFDTYEKACEYASKLQKLDPYFHVYVGNVGQWLPFDPAPDSDKVENQEYANEQLNKLMKGHKENQEKANDYHEQRKSDMIQKNISDNIKIKEKEDEDAAAAVAASVAESAAEDSSNDILEQLNQKIQELELENKNLSI